MKRGRKNDQLENEQKPVKFCANCQTRIRQTRTYCSATCAREKKAYLPTEEEIYREAERLRNLRPEHERLTVEIKIYDNKGNPL